MGKVKLLSCTQFLLHKLNFFPCSRVILKYLELNFMTIKVQAQNWVNIASDDYVKLDVQPDHPGHCSS